MSENAAVPTIQIHNDDVRVTEWRFKPGAATGQHRHEYPYVVVPITTGQLSITTAEGYSTADLVTGQPYYRQAGVEHNVSNANAFEFVFVEVKVKPTR